MIDRRERLDLTFFSTGAWQHVFVRTGREPDTWVYKIPAAFGYLLPFDHPRRTFRSNEIYAQTLLFLFINLPKKMIGKERSVFHRLPSAMGEKLLRRYLKRVSLEHFEAMIEVIEYLSRRGLADILLPCQVLRNREAVLRIDGAAFAYSGPLLMQKKADFLFEGTERLDAFEWREIIEAQHRLWRHGVTLRRLHGMFGPRGWALTDGHLRLCDTSGLTRDPRTARQSLSEKELNEKEQSVTGGANKSSDTLADYFRFMRREINRDKLDELWRADL